MRAAVAVSANIAEGCGRTGDRDFRRFVRFALGSATELEYHLLFARDAGVLSEPAYDDLSPKTVDIKRMLSALARRLGSNIER